MNELALYVTNVDEINRKYRGKRIAIVSDKVVASGDDPKEVWEKAKKKCPNKQPVLTFVHHAETIVFF